jgi:hypothetical protein
MNRPAAAFALLLMVGAAGVLPAQDPAQKIDLKVLYAGVPDAARTKDFTDFLSKTFTEVKAIELKKLDLATAKPFDVVIVDAPTPYRPDSRESGSSFKMPEAPTPHLTTDFTKPTILMGAAGGRVLLELKIKLGWL